MSKIKWIAASLAATVLLSACASQTDAVETLPDVVMTPEQINYETTQVVRGDYTRTEGGVFSAVYPAVEYIMCPSDDMRITSMITMHADVPVSKGDVLVTLESTRDYSIDIESCRLQLERKQEETAEGIARYQESLADAKAAAQGLTGHEQRIAQLRADKLQAEYDEYRLRAEQEQNRLRGQIAELQEKANPEPIVAPCDGVVQPGSYGIGETVGAGYLLLTITTRDQFYLTTDNPDVVEEVIKVQRYHMQVEIPKKDGSPSVTGKVISAANLLPQWLLDEHIFTRSWQVVGIRLDDETLKAKNYNSGSWCTSIIEQVRDVLVVDAEAIHKESGKYFVYVLENGMPQKRYVIPGLYPVGEQVWILDGLTEGQTLVLN